MDDNLAILHYTRMLEDLDRKFRGAFLLKDSTVENYLNGLIGWFFFPNDFNERKKLVGHIISDITFSNKIGIFLKLLHIYHKEILEKHPALENDLEKVKKLRNRLAHSNLDTSLQYLKTKPTNIRLEFWEGDRREYQEFSEKDVNKKIGEVYELHNQLIQVYEELTGKKQQRVVDTAIDSKEQKESL